MVYSRGRAREERDLAVLDEVDRPPGEVGEPPSAVEALDETRGRQRIGETGIGADDGRLVERDDVLACPGVADVGTALVEATGRDRALVEVHDLDHLHAVVGILYADGPRLARRLKAPARDIAGGVDRHVGDAARHCQVGDATGGPALDVARRIDAAGHRPRVEGALGQLAGVGARIEHLTDDRRHSRQIDQAVAQHGDRRVSAVGGEPCIDLMEERDRVGHDLVGVVGQRVTAEVEDDRRTPHVLDVQQLLPFAGPGVRDGGLGHVRQLTGRPWTSPPASRSSTTARSRWRRSRWRCWCPARPWTRS